MWTPLSGAVVEIFRGTGSVHLCLLSAVRGLIFFKFKPRCVFKCALVGFGNKAGLSRIIFSFSKVNMVNLVNWTFYVIMLQAALWTTLADSDIARPSPPKDRFKCYVCYWVENDESCGDSNFTVLRAEAGKYMVNCRACYKQSLFSENGEKLKVLRGCAQDVPHYGLFCQQVYYQDGSYIETCGCSAEYCNNALRPIGTWILPLLGLMWLLAGYS